MIVAFLITTGGLVWRRYVDAYCGRSALIVVSAVRAGVAAGAACGAGAREARAPPPAQAAASSVIRMRFMVTAYLTSSKTKGAPTNSIFTMRRGVSFDTYIAIGTWPPVTSRR